MREQLLALEKKLRDDIFEFANENSNSNLADIITAHLTYSTENYEEKDAKNNFLVDPKKSDVSELDYHGYKLSSTC